MSDYQIKIAMDQPTVEHLINGGYSLYAFKAVNTGNKGGVPLVWFKTTKFSAGMEIDWSVAYEAYTSSSDSISGGTVTASNHSSVDLGQTFSVTDASGAGAISATGTPQAIQIANSSGVPFVCGISQPVAGVSTPLCAFPLAGQDMDIIAPIQQVVLVFAAKQFNTGSVIEQAFGQGVVIDLTAVPTRSLTFEQNAGWSWATGETWAKTIPASGSLVPFVIVSTPSLQAAQQRQMAVAEAK